MTGTRQKIAASDLKLEKDFPLADEAAKLLEVTVASGVLSTSDKDTPPVGLAALFTDPKKTRLQVITDFKELFKASSKPQLFFSTDGKKEIDVTANGTELDAIASKIYAMAQYANLVKEVKALKPPHEALVKALEGKKTELYQALADSKAGEARTLNPSVLVNAHSHDVLVEGLLGFQGNADLKDTYEDIVAEARYIQFIENIKKYPEQAAALGILEEKPIKDQLLAFFAKNRPENNLAENFLKALAVQFRAVRADSVGDTGEVIIRKALADAFDAVGIKVTIDDSVIKNSFETENQKKLIDPFIKITPDEAKKIAAAANYQAHLQGIKDWKDINPVLEQGYKKFTYTAEGIAGWEVELKKAITKGPLTSIPKKTAAELDQYLDEQLKMDSAHARLIVDVIIYQAQQSTGADYSKNLDFKSLYDALTKQPFTKTAVLGAIEDVKDATTHTVMISKADIEKYLNLKGLIDDSAKGLTDYLTARTLMSKKQADDIIKAIVHQARLNDKIVANYDDKGWDDVRKGLMKLPFTPAALVRVFPNDAKQEVITSTITAADTYEYLKIDEMGGFKTAKDLNDHLAARQGMTEAQANDIIATLVYQARQDAALKTDDWPAPSDARWSALRDNLQRFPATQAGLESFALDQERRIQEELKKISSSQFGMAHTDAEKLSPAKIAEYLNLNNLKDDKTATATTEHFAALRKISAKQSHQLFTIFDGAKGTAIITEANIKKALKAVPFTYEQISAVMQAQPNGITDARFADALMADFTTRRATLSTAEREVLSGLRYDFFEKRDPSVLTNPALAAILVVPTFRQAARAYWTKNPNASLFKMEDIINELIKKDMTWEGANTLFEKHFNVPDHFTSDTFQELQKGLKLSAKNNEWLSNVENLVVRQFLIREGIRFENVEAAMRACQYLNLALLKINPTSIQDLDGGKAVMDLLFTDDNDFAKELESTTTARLGALRNKRLTSAEIIDLKADQVKIKTVYKSCADTKASPAFDDVGYSNFDTPTVTKPIVQEFRRLLLKNGLRFKDKPTPSFDKMFEALNDNLHKYDYTGDATVPFRFREDVLAPIIEGDPSRFLEQDFDHLQIYGIGLTLTAGNIRLMANRRDEENLILRLNDIVTLTKNTKDTYADLKYNVSAREGKSHDERGGVLGLDMDKAIDTHKKLSDKLSITESRLKHRKAELQALQKLCNDFAHIVNQYKQFELRDGELHPKLDAKGVEVPNRSVATEKAKIIAEIQAKIVLDNGGTTTADDQAKAQAIYELVLAESVPFKQLQSVIYPDEATYPPRRTFTKELNRIEHSLRNVKIAQANCHAIQQSLVEGQKAKASSAPEHATYVDEVGSAIDIGDEKLLQEEFKKMQGAKLAPQALTLSTGGGFSGAQKGKTAAVPEGKQVVHYNPDNQTFFTVKNEKKQITTTLYVSTIEAPDAKKKQDMKVTGRHDEHVFLAEKTKNLFGGSLHKAYEFWKGYKARPLEYHSARSYLIENASRNQDLASGGDEALKTFESFYPRKAKSGFTRVDMLAKEFAEQTTTEYEDKMGNTARMPKEEYFQAAIDAFLTHRAATLPVPLVITGYNKPTVDAMRIVCLALEIKNYIDKSPYNNIQPDQYQANMALSQFPRLRDLAAQQRKAERTTIEATENQTHALPTKRF